jgi:hypothetical protein
VQAWYTTYQNAGLEVIGVHTPEYAFAHDPGNVQSGAQRLGISYPIALDNSYATWTSYSNESWPVDYLIDATGRVRHVTIGEGDYAGTESLIRQLLTAANPGAELPPATQVGDTTPTDPQQTRETYLGAERAQNFAGDTPLAEGVQTFPAPTAAPDDEFSLSGTWSITKESISSLGDSGIGLNFISDEVYLDLGGTGTDTETVTVDGTTTSYQVSGAPNIYTLVDRPSQSRDALQVSLTVYTITESPAGRCGWPIWCRLPAGLRRRRGDRHRRPHPCDRCPPAGSVPARSGRCRGRINEPRTAPICTPTAIATTVATTPTSSVCPESCPPAEETSVIATRPNEPGTNSQKAGRKVTAAGHRGCINSRNRRLGSMIAAAMPLATGAAASAWAPATTA